MLARKSLLLFTVNMIGSALGFLSTIVIARWMGATALGSVSYLLGLLGMFSVLLDMGFAFAHLKRVSETSEDPAPLIGTFLAVKSSLALVFLLVALLLPGVAGSLGRDLIPQGEERLSYYLIAAFYVLHSLASVFLYTFEARLESAKQSIPDLVGSLVSFVAKLGVAFSGAGVVALSAAYLTEPLARLGLAVPLFRGYRIARPQRQHFASYVRYTLPITLNTALSMVLANINPVLIKAFWTAAEVGYYSSVLGFGLVLERVASTVMVLFLPQTSSDAARGDWSEIRRRLFVIERYVLTILVPLGVALAFFSRDIVLVALGSEFTASAPILVLLALNSIGAGIFQPYRTLLYAIEKQQYLVLSSVAGLAALLLSGLLLIPQRIGSLTLAGLGSVGAALGLIAMTVTSGIVQVEAVRRHVAIGLYAKVWVHLLAGGVMYGCMHVVSRFMPASLWLRLPLLSLLGGAACLAVLALAGEFTRSDAQVFLNVLRPTAMADYIAAELEKGR